MDDGFIGYDPQRLQTLTTRTGDAVDHLDRTTCDDPAAGGATGLLRNVSFQLQTVWLPFFARLGADPSMRSWIATGPRIAVGVDQSAGFAGTAGSPDRQPTDPEDLARVAELVESVENGDTDAVAALVDELAGDDELLAALLVALGPDGLMNLLGVLVGWEGPGDPAVIDDLAVRLRDGLGLVGAAEGFPPERVADGLFGANTTQHPEWQWLATFVVQGDTVPNELVAAIGGRLVDLEASGSTVVAVDQLPWNRSGAVLPYGSIVQLEPGSEATWADPLVGVLDALGDGPQALRDFLTDDNRLYGFTQRAWPDGCEAILVASAAACAGPDLRDPTTPPDQGIIDQVNTIAAQTVNGLAHNPLFDPASMSAAASEAAGRIAGFHLMAFDQAVQSGFDDIIITDADVQHPRTVTHLEDAFGAGYSVEVPLLGEHEAGSFIQAAGASDEGIAALGEGLGAYQQELAAGTADQVQSGAFGQELVNRQLGQSARLQGFVAGQVGIGAQNAGRQADQAIARLINLAGFVVRPVANIRLADTGLSWITGLQGDAEDRLTSALATGEAEAIVWADDYASAAAVNLVVTYTDAFVDAGLVPPVSGNPALGGWETFAAGSSADRSEYWNVLTNYVPPSGETVVLNPNIINEAFVSVQFPAFIPLPAAS